MIFFTLPRFLPLYQKHFLYLWNLNCKEMKISSEDIYVSPVIVFHEFEPEGVLCGSTEGVEEGDGPPWDTNYLGAPLY